jgi:cyclic pyranopterin phosphate synthase
MLDRFDRKLDYLRISVTDRCNLRCIYCMPEEGIQMLTHDDILTYEEIMEVVHIAVGLGISKIRITGGEPLVRKGVTDLVRKIAAVPGIKDLGLTTNGTLLEHFAKPLAEAGLHRINISLDTVNPERYREITRGGELSTVFRGIRAAKEAGLSPIKINCVVRYSSTEPEAIGVKRFGEKEGLIVRFIHEMNLVAGCFTTVEGGEGGNCGSCNRLRLTPNGIIKPCLFSDIGFNIRELGIREAFMKATTMKPEKGTSNSQDSFNFLGG